jgi:hypothetical protein
LGARGCWFKSSHPDLTGGLMKFIYKFNWMLLGVLLVGIVIYLLLPEKKNEIEFLQGGDIEKAIETQQ